MKVKETYIVKIVKKHKPGYVGFYGNRNYLKEVVVYLLDDDTYRMIGEDGDIHEISKNTFEEYKKNCELTSEEVEAMYIRDDFVTAGVKRVPFFEKEKE